MTSHDSRPVLVVPRRLLAPMAGGWLLSATLACSPDGRPPNAPPDELPAEWSSAREAHGDVGLQATLDLQGDPLHVTGEPEPVDVAAPFSLAPAPLFPNDGAWLYFAEATVEGQGAGFLVVEGAVQAASGRIAAVQVVEVEAGQAVGLVPKDEGGEKPEVSFPEAWADAGAAFFFAARVAAPVEAVALSGFTRATLLTDAGPVDLTAPVVVTAPGLYFDAASTLRPDTARLVYPRFALALDATGGALSIEGRSDVVPSAVMGQGAALELSAGAVRSDGPFRATQAVVDEGLAIDAEVELLPTGERVDVAGDGTAYLGIHFREKSYAGDAVLADVVVEGDGKAAVTVPVAQPPLLIERLWSHVQDAGWAGPIVAIPVVLASPAILMLDVAQLVGCAFTFCPEQYPYPLWMDAGAIGTFYVKVDGSALPPGEHDVLVRLVGRNYATLEVPFTIAVE